jgi:hypothetical protein
VGALALGPGQHGRLEGVMLAEHVLGARAKAIAETGEPARGPGGRPSLTSASSPSRHLPCCDNESTAKNAAGNVTRRSKPPLGFDLIPATVAWLRRTFSAH